MLCQVDSPLWINPTGIHEGSVGSTLPPALSVLSRVLWVWMLTACLCYHTLPSNAS